MLDDIKIAAKIIFANWRWQKLRRLLKGLDLKGFTNDVFLFYTIRTYDYILTRELLLAFIIAKLGGEVHVILDNGKLIHWDTLQQGDVESLDREQLNPHYKSSFKVKVRNLLSNNKTKLFDHQNINFHYTGDILNSFSPFEENETKLEKLKKYAISSTQRFFRSSEHNNKEGAEKYLRLSTRNASLNEKVGFWIAKNINPDHFITSHGIYSVWGPAFDYLENNTDTRCLVFGNHGHRNRHLLISNVKLQLLSQSSGWKYFSQKESHKTKVYREGKRFLRDRVKGSPKDLKGTQETVDDSINISENWDHIVGAFPNVSWDGNIEEIHRVFEDQVHWLLETIKHFKKKPNTLLVIRFHPSETTLWSKSEGVEKIIRRHIPNIDEYDNVMLISSNNHVSSYGLIEKYLDVVTLYSGMLALEAQHLKTPVITLSNGRFSGAVDSCFEPKTKEAYLSMLNNLEEVGRYYSQNYSEIIKKVYLFSYWYSKKVAYFFPLFSPSSYNKQDITRANLSDFDIEAQQEFRRTIGKLIGGFE